MSACGVQFRAFLPQPVRKWFYGHKQTVLQLEAMLGSYDAPFRCDLFSMHFVNFVPAFHILKSLYLIEPALSL